MTTPATLEAEADRLDAAAYAEAHRGGTRDYSKSARSSDARIFRGQAAVMRKEMGMAPASASLPATQPTPARPIAKTPDTHTREESIGIIAAGAPFDLPAGMVANAIADGTPVDAFALAVAGHCVRARAAEQHEAEVDATAARIAGYVPSARVAAPKSAVAAVGSDVDQVAAQILAFLPSERVAESANADADAIAARIAAA
jgi:hypothetical protein